MNRPVAFLLFTGSVVLLPLFATLSWITKPASPVLNSSLNKLKHGNEEFNDSIIKFLTNRKGPKLGYSTKSGISIIRVGELFFKDLNRNNKLDKYEDWRLSVDERARDLARRMSIEQIAGMMLYSRHQAIPTAGRGVFAGTYHGKTYEE